MKKKPVLSSCLFLIVAFALFKSSPILAQHEFNGPYRGENLNRVAFPIGGIGAGMYCLEGTGAISHMSVRHSLNFFNEPSCFAAVCVLGDTPEQNIARVVEGPIPNWKYFGAGGTGNGAPGSTYGFPRFKECEFLARFPFAMISLKDKSLPIDVQLTGWSPFTPPNPNPSSWPVGALEYTFVNKTDKPVKAVFSFNSRNFMNGNGSIGEIEGGFILYNQTGAERDTKGAFAFFVDGDDAIVDHCWFRGGWWDALTIAWDNVVAGRMINNPPVGANAPGATLAVPFDLPARGEKTIRLLTAWYVPESQIVVSNRIGGGPAFQGAPSRGAGTGQQTVTGFLGRGFVNTFDKGGDDLTGTLTSDPFEITKKNVHFLIGGGRSCAAQLLLDGKVVKTASGNDQERLEWVTWDVTEFIGKKAEFRIVDQAQGAWGHINLDHIVFSDEPINDLKTGSGNNIVNDAGRVIVFEDFEGRDYSGWTVSDIPKPETVCEPGSDCCPTIPDHYIPWYATQFGSLEAVAAAWRGDYRRLRRLTETFTDAFYDSTLPPVVLEAAAANLTIIKSPTVLRQHDGRLWCWEGCSDNSGCCSGTCTHVWNYAQAICHLFPTLEQSLRQTEYIESQQETGRQAFRANLPIAPGGVAFDAADGQLGGIMKFYREWKATNNNQQWLEVFWPKLKTGMDFMIAEWDPRHTGLLEESHHNTYDINYYGPDGHCGSFYLGALATMVEMGTALGQDVTFYKELLAKGQKAMVEKLFNGEYFIQIVAKEGLTNNFGQINPADQSAGYRDIARIVNEQGPKYQYGNGCLSDGVLGFWMAKVCGYENDIVDEAMIRSHLLSIYKYNMRHDLSEHANPQRPSYAMGNDGGLLLCTWPYGGKPMLPFVYSDEVWTGIEYQVASHLMLLGEPAKGLDIAETVRKRHDGVRRNPFNEYECGHWYARAMSSYAMLQGLTGVRYDARTQTLFVDSRVGDFKSFLCTETGFGTVTFADGKVNLDVRSGKIDVQNVVVKTGK
ncbi:MAG: non-lysosomal glucosylceramidase [Planctomycetaceae bacterium]|nr:non-lysosomal glucosylceramidase [Planctomycetaceae bacterium]